jgi:hypothetical protein
MSVVPPKKNRLEGRKLWFFFTAVAGLLTGIVFFIIASQVTATTKYYVLNSDIPARTQISEANVQEIVTSTGGQPPTALTEFDILSGQVYSKIALDAGDVLTPSNAGLLDPINTGLPKDFVTSTFTAPASMAVGGKIERGNYIDIITLTDDPVTGDISAGYTLQHALVVDATIDLDSAAGAEATPTTDPETGETTAPAADAASVRVGIPTMYTLGLNQRDAAKLALAYTNNTIYIVLSADQSSDAVIPDIDITISAAELRGLIGNAGAGTDNTFGNGTLKDENGNVIVEEPATDGTQSTTPPTTAPETGEPTDSSSTSGTETQ